jgi:hypothetical protein
LRFVALHFESLRFEALGFEALRFEILRIDAAPALVEPVESAGRRARFTGRSLDWPGQSSPTQ